MFSTDQITQVLASRDRAQALDAWREAANLVATRWQRFLEAESDGRRWAFALLRRSAGCRSGRGR